MNINEFNIKEYCEKCRAQIVRPFHGVCFKKCKYSFPSDSEEFKRGYRYIPCGTGEWDVYFIKCEKYIKIGATKDIEKRMDEIRRNNPFDIQILILLGKLSIRTEKALHKYFFESNHKREWFYYDESIRCFLNSNTGKIKRIINKIIWEIGESDLGIIEAQTDEDC
jgi:hypothetical protein